MDTSNLIDFIDYRQEVLDKKSSDPEDLGEAIQLLIQHLREAKSG